MLKRTFTDQLNRKITIHYPPQRIISLVPSQTELLFDLGLDEEIIAVTKFCIHPAEKARKKAGIGGTKKLNLGKIRQLSPDLIIANKEENEKEQLELLMQEFPVWVSDIYELADALDMIVRLGTITGKIAQAQELRGRIVSSFDTLHAAASKLRVAYFIWKDPYMVAGHHTFINSMMNIAGCQNAFSQSRYPLISAEELKRAEPDLIFLSSEPYPFREKHVREFEQICPGVPVLLVDGEFFSWYGSRLQLAPGYFMSLREQIRHYLHDLK